MIGPWLAIAVTVAAGVARFVTLEQAKDRTVEELAQHAIEHDKLKTRVEQLERERADAARQDEQLKLLREDMREVKITVRSVEQQVSRIRR